MHDKGSIEDFRDFLFQIWFAYPTGMNNQDVIGFAKLLIEYETLVLLNTCHFRLKWPLCFAQLKF